MPYDVKIDRKNCQGHARCAARAPELYILDAETGYIASDGFAVPVGREAEALAGARSCPERVIALFDEHGLPVQKVRAAS